MTGLHLFDLIVVMERNKRLGWVCICIAVLLFFMPKLIEGSVSPFAMSGWAVGSYSWATILTILGIGFLLPTNTISLERKKFVGWVIISVAVLLFVWPGNYDEFLSPGPELIGLGIFSFAWAMILIVIGIGFLLPSK